MSDFVIQDDFSRLSLDFRGFSSSFAIFRRLLG